LDPIISAPRKGVAESGEFGLILLQFHCAGNKGRASEVGTDVDRAAILSTIRERMTAFATSRLLGEVAEDLAQEVFLVLHEKYPEVTELSELLPLSFQILRFKMVEARRKAFRRGEHNQIPVEDLPLADPGGDPETELRRKQMLEQLIAAMNQLGQRCRDLFRWKLQGKTFPEIQVLMGQRSINTIYTWDSRCRKQLLQLMGGRWENL